MPNPATILSAYPTQAINDIIKEKNPKTLHVYIDIKNVAISLFVESVCAEILNVSECGGYLDSSIFQSFFYISSEWKKYAIARNLHLKIFLITDIGRSESYHKKIDKRYKENRDIVGHTSPVGSTKIKEIRDQNFNLGDQICNKFEDIFFFNLKFLESDFLSYYLISRKFQNDDSILHIICSSDHDLYQNLLFSNTVQIYKSRQIKVTMDYRQIFTNWSHVEKSGAKNKSKKYESISKLNPWYFPAMMGITGDAGDDVEGVRGVGALTVLNMFDDQEIVMKLIGTPQELDDRVASGGKFFKEDEIGLKNLSKKWQKVFLENDLVTRSFKLVSFEQLSRYLENSSLLEDKKYLKYIDDVLEKKDVDMMPSAYSFLTAIHGTLSDNYLTEDMIDPLFI